MFKKIAFAALTVLTITVGTASIGSSAHAVGDPGSQRNTGWIGSSGNG